jgi:hypothetical protein
MPHQQEDHEPGEREENEQREEDKLSATAFARPGAPVFLQVKRIFGAPAEWRRRLLYR